jgi:hypothetical protein
MAISDEKFPWESYTEMVAFVGLLVGLVGSFNLIPGLVISTEQVSGIAAILFLLVMIARKYGSGGQIVLSKTP